MKFKPYFKITYFQDEKYEHNDTEIIVDKKDDIRKLFKWIYKNLKNI